MTHGLGRARSTQAPIERDRLREGTDRSSFEFTFDEPGVYPFYCRIHGGPGRDGQFGVIVVFEPGQSPPAGRYSADPDLLKTIAAERASEDSSDSITPPSTGDAGLLNREGRNGYAELAVALGALSVAAAVGWSGLRLFVHRQSSTQD